MSYSPFIKRNCDECAEENDSFGPLSLQKQIQREQLGFREIYINGVINSKLIEEVVVQIANINRYDDECEKKIVGHEREVITIFIHSPGGTVSDSFAVVSAIKASKTKVRTVALGEAMSGGFLILLAGDERYSQLYSTLMYHDLSSGTGGTAEAVREYSEHLDALQERIKKFVIENSYIEEKDLNDCHYRKHDWYMDTFRALELGVVDGIWPPEVYVASEEEVDECKCDETCEGGCDGCECEDTVTSGYDY